MREHGVRLAESRLKRSDVLRESTLALAGDADSQVRFQVALTLGEWDDDRIVPALAKIGLAGPRTNGRVWQWPLRRRHERAVS